MDKAYILAIDQSTSGTKALLVNRMGQIVAKMSIEHTQHYPLPGWVEQDAVEIYENVKRCIRDVLREGGISPRQVAALALTNQRETAVMWDRATGRPICNAIVWQCQRTADQCRAYQAAGLEPQVRAATGLLLDPYFSATKWAWMLEHVSGAREKLASGRLLAGTVDSWLLWKLTGGQVHATDYSNASRTSLFNIHTLQWDEEMCALFQVPIEILPEVRASDAVFGYTEDPDLFAEGIPIAGVIGDSQGALFGQQCVQPGMAKATFGTGTSVLLNTGVQPTPGRDGLVTTIAWGLGGQVTYALEAVIRTTGDTIKWVRDNLGLFRTFAEMEQLLVDVRDAQGVHLVPAFVGLGAPYWEPAARAAILGISRGTGKGHIVRAALESIAYQVAEAVALMHQSGGVELHELRADGGGSNNSVLMQFQADMLGRPVRTSAVSELSALGSVYFAGLATGFWRSSSDIAGLQVHEYRVYQPNMASTERDGKLMAWRRAVRAVLSQSSGGES